MNNFVTRALTSIVLAAGYAILFLYFPPMCFSAVLAALLIVVLLTEWPALVSPRSQLFWLLTPLYPIAPFAALIYLNQQDPHIVLLLFLLVFSFDIGSYIFGNLFGKHKIAPAISPGKTWEGALGGCATALILMWFINPLLVMKHGAWVAAACVLALCGDFFESWLKRRAGRKDSGIIIPGHGGILDRFDGVLLVALAVALVHIILRHPSQ